MYGENVCNIFRQPLKILKKYSLHIKFKTKAKKLLRKI